MIESMVFVTLILLIAATGYFFRYPERGLLAVIFLLPFEKIGSYSVSAQGGSVIRLVQIAGAALILAYFSRLITGHEKLKFCPPLPLVLFAVSTFVSAGIINNPRVWQNYIWALFVFGLFCVVANLINKRNLQKVFIALMSSALAVSIFGLLQYFGDLMGLPSSITGLSPGYSKIILGYPRLQSVAIEPLNFANYLLLPLFVGLSWAAYTNFKNKRLNVTMAVISFAFLLTTSRGAFVALPFGLAVLVYCQRNLIYRHGKILILSALSVAIIAGCTLSVSSKIATDSWLHGPKQFSKMFVSQFTNNASFQERAQSNTQALAVCSRSGLFGFGLGKHGLSPLPRSPMRAEYDRINPLNSWMEVYCETGIVGAGLFIWFLLALAIATIHSINTASAEVRAGIVGLASALAAILIQAQSFSAFYITYIWVALGLLAGLVSGSAKYKFSFKNLRHLLN